MGLTVAQQFFHLRRNTIFGGEGSVSRGKLVWRYERQPTIYSRTYSVRVTQKEGDIPDVYVDAPDLSLLADGRKLPHIYAERPPRLCLYFPKTKEWSSSDRIDETLLPWTDLWLYYYEDWLFFDDWKGSGEHPDGSEFSSRNLRRFSLRNQRRRGLTMAAST